MGFFSRLFNLDAKATQLPSALVQGSEISLDARAAEAVLAELDVDAAIAAHEQWKQRLAQHLRGEASEPLDPAVVCLDNRCELGRWLHGAGRARLGKYPAFTVLVARHQYFHTQAAEVLTQAQSGQHEAAEKALNGAFRYASSQVVLLLKELKRGLGR